MGTMLMICDGQRRPLPECDDGSKQLSGCGREASRPPGVRTIRVEESQAQVGKANERDGSEQIISSCETNEHKMAATSHRGASASPKQAARKRELILSIGPQAAAPQTASGDGEGQQNADLRRTAKEAEAGAAGASGGGVVSLTPSAPQHQNDHTIKATRKRYFILIMFVLLQMIKSFQWICLAGITNVVANFYGVDNLAINWTTILFMVTFLVLALPVSWLMDAIGLRRSVLIGSLGVTLGVLIKCFSCHRAGFALSMAGHLIIGLAEPFFFSSYAQLASIWFPDHQVALATAASLVGEQFGLALGFLIPPLMIGNDSQDFQAIEWGLSRLFQAMALICTLNTLSIVIFFDEKPRFAPGLARHRQISEEQQRRQSCSASPTSPTRSADGRPAASCEPPVGFVDRGRRLSRRMSQNLGEQVKLSSKFVTSKHFLLLMVGFGLNQGVSYSLHTLLNQMIMRPALPESFEALEAAPPSSAQAELHAAGAINASAPAQEQQLTAAAELEQAASLIVVGNAGLILILAGLLGSALCGLLLDRHHRYKLTTAAVYLLGLLAMAALTGCLLLGAPHLLYLAAAPLGFALTGYASCGFDYGVEITYPKPELLSSTLLNLAAQLFGIPISLIGSLIVDRAGSLALGAFFGACLLAGFVVTLLQGGALRRQQAIEQQRQQKLAGGARGLQVH